MTVQTKHRRFIGQILLDGGFVSRQKLDSALAEQKRTNELLGHVLVKMGILDPTDIAAALSVQEHLDCVEEAVRIAAGVRRMLGDLLIQAGCITSEDLDCAIAEQRRSGEKLGEVLVRQGLLTERELSGMLDFQHNLGASCQTTSPLRLGEILISTGAISRSQLDDALQKQTGSRKRLGEVLVDEGYAKPQHIKHGMRLQQMLLTAVLVGLLAACGGGGSAESGAATASASTATSVTTTQTTTSQNPAHASYLSVTYDEYGLVQPNFYHSTNNAEFWSIQANVAVNEWDPEFKTVIRIDIPKTEAGAMPSIGGKIYAIEEGTSYEQFPGVFLVFNGQKSTLKKVGQGTISFAPNSTENEATGDFDVILTDNDSSLVPPPQYHLKGVFHYVLGTS